MALTPEYLKSLTKEKRLPIILKEYGKCVDSAEYTITTYFTLIDPILSKRVPVSFYPYQRISIRDFVEFDYNMTMKTRQTGMTTITELFVAWFMSTKGNQVINILAQEKKTSRKFLRSVRKVLDDARLRAPWLIPHYDKTNNGRDSFGLNNGSTILAEANKPDACRGDTINLLVIDEVAAITWMEDIWAAAGLTLTRSQGKCIAISTPKGMAGWYFEQYTDAANLGWNIINAHWSEHPLYKQGMYQFIKDDKHPKGGYIKFLDNSWPDMNLRVNKQRYKAKDLYPFVLDGRIRSPWYDFESRKLGPRKTKCELDCSFAGSGGEVIDPEKIRDLEINARTFPPINPPGKGLMKSYKEFFEPEEGHVYILSADTSTGDGSDFSGFVVVDVTEMKVVATFKEQLDPREYAKIIEKIAIRYFKALVVVEYQYGITTLLCLKDELKYTNLFYSTLRKTEITKVQKRKIGFWQSETTRTLGGDRLEEAINNGDLKFWSLDIIAELYTWVWDKRGRRDHLPEKHDDLLMALTMAMYVIHHVMVKRANAQQMMRKHLSRTRTETFVGTHKGLFEEMAEMNLDENSKEYIKTEEDTPRRTGAVFGGSI